MTEYKNLFKLDIPSKTLENSNLVMNRQVWTNEKSSLSGVGGGPGRNILKIHANSAGIRRIQCT
jgi:hypothetical protein